MAGAVVLAALVTLAVLLPWAVRNHRVLNRWLWSTSNDGITLYDGFHPDATGASQQDFVTRMPQLKGMGELERSDYLKAEAMRLRNANPGRTLMLAVAKIGRTWSPVPLSAEFGRPLYRAIAGLFSVPFDVLILVGLIVAQLRRPVVIFLVLPAVYFTTVHGMSVGSLRYRIPVEPPLAVIAGAGAAALLQRGIKRRGPDARAVV